MSDDRFDQELNARLHAYEAHLPDDEPPDVHAASRPVRWLPLAAAAAVVVLVGAGLALATRSPVGQPPPTASVSAEGSPSWSAVPSAVAPTPSAAPSEGPTPSAAVDPTSRWHVTWAEGPVISGGQVVRVVVEDNVFWALGFTVDTVSDAGAEPVIWRSEDGTIVGAIRPGFPGEHELHPGVLGPRLD